MKKSLFVVLAFIMPLSAFASTCYQVTGAGSPQANGLYKDAGLVDPYVGDTEYTNGFTYLRRHADTVSVIFSTLTSGGGSSTRYYSDAGSCAGFGNIDSMLACDIASPSNWILQIGGTNPTPTLSIGVCPYSGGIIGVIPAAGQIISTLAPVSTGFFTPLFDVALIAVALLVGGILVSYIIRVFMYDLQSFTTGVRGYARIRRKRK